MNANQRHVALTPDVTLLGTLPMITSDTTSAHFIVSEE